MKNKLFLLSLFFFLPLTSFADISFSPDLKTIGCYDVNDGNVTVTGTHQSVGFSNDGHITDFVHWNISGTLDLTATPDSGTLTLPTTFNTYNYYNAGWVYDLPLTADLTIQDTPCGEGGGGTATSTATSTASTGDLAFGLAIIIFLLSFGLISMIYFSMNKSKPWK